MNHEDLQAMAEMDANVIKAMRELMEENEQDFIPMLVFIRKNGDRMVSLFQFSNYHEKHMAMLAAGFAAREAYGDLVAFAFIAEAWYLTLSEEERDIIKALGEEIPAPSNAASRKEGMFITYMDIKTKDSVFVVIPIERDDDGRAIIGEPDLKEDTTEMESNLLDTFFRGYNYISGVKL
jgi:hypothetical protein